MHRRTGTRSSPNPRSQGSQQRVLPPRRTREKQRSSRKTSPSSGRALVTFGVTFAPRHQTRGVASPASFR
jgi:hypothetical protein